jgi:hypothetical protein
MHLAGVGSATSATSAAGEVGFEHGAGARRLLAAGLLLLALLLGQVVASSSSSLDGLPALGGSDDGASAAAVPSEREILDRLAAAPVGFVENVGQGHRSATHLAQGPGYAFAFGRDGVRVSLVEQARAGGAAAASLSVGLEFVGANPNAEAVLAGRPSGGADYLVGERSRWRTGVATYPELVYRELWPGVDMAFTGSRGALKYEFRVAPGADPSRIQLAYGGAQSLSLTSAGALSVNTTQGALKDKAPVSYQTVDGRRVPVESSFALGQGNAYGFTLGAYDQSKPLVIDPALQYSTFLGGSAEDAGLSIAVRGDDAYVTGATFSADFPVTHTAYDTSPNGGQDAFVARLDTTKRRRAGLEYSTYLGGFLDDAGLGIAFRGSDAYVTGIAVSPNFPTTANAYDQSFNGFPADVWVSRIDTEKAGAASLEYSTYIGSGGLDIGLDLVVKGQDVIFTGLAGAENFPTANAYDSSFNGGGIDGFVARLDTGAGAAGLEYSSFLGGGGPDSGRGIVVKGNDAFIAGPTGSPNFPTTANAFDDSFNGGGLDAFVTRLDLNQGAAGLEYSTYLGGAGTEDQPPPERPGTSIDVVGQDAYVSGVTNSPNFPTTPNAYDTSHNGDRDAFVTRLDTNQSGAAGLEYSTYLGGSGEDIGREIDVNRRGEYVIGATTSADFPVTGNAFQANNQGGQDAFVTRLDIDQPGAAGLRFSTYLGGSDTDFGRAIVARRDHAFVTGFTRSADFPKRGAFDPSFNGVQDGFVTRLDTDP